MQTTRIRDEIKFLYKKREKLNGTLYKTHVQAALEWDQIRSSIHNSINQESERKYRLLDCADVHYTILY